MAQGKPATPEKELLNLIEKPMSRGTLNAATIKYHGLSWLSMGGLKGRFAFFRNRLKFDFRAKSFRELDIRTLNKILKISLVGLSVYYVIFLSMSIANLNKELKFEVKIEKAGEGVPAKTNSFLRSASYYLERAKEKDIFRKGMKKIMAATGVMKTPSQKMLELTQNYRLVGISWSDNPDVMIEDTKTQRTFFLRRGQIIENDIILKEVFKDKVVLGLGGEEIELR
ncbi:MAG: hypothetical protein WC532_08605 [Candidatus Omnitrophota bacterium]